MKNNYNPLKFFFSLLVSLLLVGCQNNQSLPTNSLEREEAVTVTNPVIKPNDRVENIMISSIGDILVHNSVFTSAYDEKKGTYDFTPQFAKVKKYLENSDLTIANLETTLGGKERGYSGYPIFNAPDEVIDGLKNSGVDVITAANNHSIDTGEKGFFRTVKTVRDKGLDIIGVKASPQEKSYIIKDIKGIKVGIANFTYETAEYKGRRTLNGIPLPQNVEPLVDMVNLSNLEKSFKTLELRVLEMKKEGAEVLVFCMHWGNEYQRLPSKEQELMAKKLSDLGVDIIFGGHPHVLQPMDFIHSEVSNKDTFIIYSQGNFISDQRLETLNNRYTEQGIIVNVGIRKTFKDNKIEITFADYVPTWVNKKYIGNKPSYEVLPTEEVLGGIKFNNINEEDKKRIELSSKDTIALMEKFTSKAAVAPLNRKAKAPKPPKESNKPY